MNNLADNEMEVKDKEMNTGRSELENELSRCEAHYTK